MLLCNLGKSKNVSLSIILKSNWCALMDYKAKIRYLECKCKFFKFNKDMLHKIVCSMRVTSSKGLGLEIMRLQLNI